jgi:hypothetical protein
MKWLAQLVVAAAVLTTPLAASAQSLTEAQARAMIAPWYSLFNQPVQGDMKTLPFVDHTESPVQFPHSHAIPTFSPPDSHPTGSLGDAQTHG